MRLFTENFPDRLPVKESYSVDHYRHVHGLATQYPIHTFARKCEAMVASAVMRPMMMCTERSKLTRCEVFPIPLAVLHYFVGIFGSH